MKFNVHCVGRQIIFHGARAGERRSSEARSEALSSPVDCHFRRMRSNSWDSAAHSCRRVQTRGTGRVRRSGAASTIFGVKSTIRDGPFSHLRNSHKIIFGVSFAPALNLYFTHTIISNRERHRIAATKVSLNDAGNFLALLCPSVCKTLATWKPFITYQMPLAISIIQYLDQICASSSKSLKIAQSVVGMNMQYRVRYKETVLAPQ